jgi:hypothetical protein
MNAGITLSAVTYGAHHFVHVIAGAALSAVTITAKHFWSVRGRGKAAAARAANSVAEQGHLALQPIEPCGIVPTNATSPARCRA